MENKKLKISQILHKHLDVTGPIDDLIASLQLIKSQYPEFPQIEIIEEWVDYECRYHHIEGSREETDEEAAERIAKHEAKQKMYAERKAANKLSKEEKAIKKAEKEKEARRLQFQKLKEEFES